MTTEHVWVSGSHPNPPSLPWSQPGPWHDLPVLGPQSLFCPRSASPLQNQTAKSCLRTPDPAALTHHPPGLGSHVVAELPPHRVPGRRCHCRACRLHPHQLLREVAGVMPCSQCHHRSFSPSKSTQGSSQPWGKAAGWRRGIIPVRELLGCPRGGGPAALGGPVCAHCLAEAGHARGTAPTSVGQRDSAGWDSKGMCCVWRIWEVLWLCLPREGAAACITYSPPASAPGTPTCP